MVTANPISATEILSEVIAESEPSFSPEFARMVLQLRLSDGAQQRVRELLGKNNVGSLDASEQSTLNNYLLVGQFIDLLQAKARSTAM